jgi:ATP-dependent Lon protease
MLEIKKAQKILDEDHYDLEKVKERILEYLSVRKLKSDLKGSSRSGKNLAGTIHSAGHGT